MGGACGTCGEESVPKGFVGNGKKRVQLQDLGTDGRKTMPILRKQWECVDWINVARDRTNGKLFWDF